MDSAESEQSLGKLVPEKTALHYYGIISALKWQTGNQKRSSARAVFKLLQQVVGENRETIASTWKSTTGFVECATSTESTSKKHKTNN